ncbi:MULTISPECIES: DUF3243 domain-containing protein [unclassified Paenibacillus]|uniref:DUF3243 family protein n=1 Tax=Paenibacillus provencensis TaxID=441151 RepID=A0ABW3PS87_9BACL|nr:MULTISPECIES: DUF3243 domain-containing protein [unclassified Paenibacillus]MCM3128862.1 DUF3243 domain-containing protein [Paenibacillus sp. MER 78]SFS49469.1 Protein of unknown function [Paenibacillus sp. 453mf]
MSEQTHMINKDGKVELNQVDDVMNRMAPEQKDDILEQFETFKQYLKKRVALGESLGLNEEQLSMVAEKVAGMLSKNEEPRNREEKLLQELWNAANNEQQHALAHVLVKFVKN